MTSAVDYATRTDAFRKCCRPREGTSMKWIVVTRPACDLRMCGALCPTCMFDSFWLRSQGSSYGINNCGVGIRGERANYLHAGADLGCRTSPRAKILNAVRPVIVTVPGAISISSVEDAKRRFSTCNHGERYADICYHRKFWRGGLPRSKLL